MLLLGSTKVKETYPAIRRLDTHDCHISISRLCSRTDLHCAQTLRVFCIGRVDMIVTTVITSIATVCYELLPRPFADLCYQ